MAHLNVDAPELSLLSLEDELSCSICLSPFRCPVTIPCGHNFCQDCLLSSWKDSYSCPQCRAVFPVRPELKKNTVLSAVVETFVTRSGLGGGQTEVKPQREEAAVAVIRCDTCMEAEASHTCLTCMASFCDEHLRPHRDNPVFRLHQLGRPMADLTERICPDHHKLMELFCSQHQRSICSLCLQQEHKGCSLTSQEEQRSLKEADFRDKLSSINDKIQKTNAIISQLSDKQSQLKEEASDKKKALAAAYRQIQDMLAQDEREAQREVDRELETGEKKLRDTATTLSKNIEKMAAGRETVDGLLARCQDMEFLQASFELPKVTKFEPHVPRVAVDSAKLKAAQAFVSGLKESLEEILNQPVEARSTLPKPDEKAADSSGSTETESSESKPKPGGKAADSSGLKKNESTGSKPKPEAAKKNNWIRSKNPGRPLVPPLFHPHFPHPQLPNPHPYHPDHPPYHPHFVHQAYVRPYVKGQLPGERPQPPAGLRPRPGAQPEYGTQWSQIPPKPSPKPEQWTQAQSRTPEPTQQTKPPDVPSDPFSGPEKRSELLKQPPDVPSDPFSSLTWPEKRSELLKHGVTLTFDPYTAHKRVALSEAFTKASVSAAPADYPDCPQRFDVCTQVLATEGFSGGRRYWEVQLSGPGPGYVGVGLAYGSIKRKGPYSRLGRNTQSWCVEWLNDRTSTWHNGCETPIDSVTARRVGVLLDYEEGTATLFRVADRAYPFHTFVFPFTEAVYPAFWLFSSDATVTLCNLRSA